MDMDMDMYKDMDMGMDMDMNMDGWCMDGWISHFIKDTAAYPP